MTSFYDKFMEYFEKRGLKLERKKLIKKCKGKVLEIGSGTGANLEFYNLSGINDLIISDYKISKFLRNKILGYNSDKINIKEVDVIDLPYGDNSFDTVVFTLVFCSVSDVNKGLEEVRRVLKPDGILLFIEHVIPEITHLKNMFNIVNPIWKKIASGCHLNRDFLDYLTIAGFEYSLDNKWFKTTFISGVAYKSYLNKM